MTTDDEQQRLSAIMENATDVILTFHENGQIQSCNPAIQRVFGYSTEEIIGQSLELLMSEQPKRQLDSYSRLNLRSQQTNILFIRNEATGRRKDDTLLPIDFTVSRMNLDTKSMYLGIIRDITTQKETETALRQAKETAEAASRVKSEFLATMSHEFRTPLNAILSLAELLQSTPLTIDQEDSVDMIYDSGHKLLTLISDILDFSNMETGKAELSVSPFALRACVETAVSQFTPQLAEKGLNLACYIKPNVPIRLVGDEVRLRQIITKLIDNAVKFTIQGDILLSVTSELLDYNQCKLQFIIKDSGIGIPADKLDQLLTPFSQVDSSSTRQFGGTGLGLAICNQLVQKMDGSLKIKSKEGQGTAVYFTIVTPFMSGETEPYLQKKPSALDGKRILLTADNVTNLELLTRQLHFWGVHVQRVDSTEQINDALHQEEPYDVMIIDAHQTIPAMIYELPPILLLMSPAFSSSHPAAAAILEKPTTTAHLFDTLTTMLTVETAVSPTPRNNSWPIDMDYVDRMLGPDSDDLLNDLIELFLEDSPVIFQNIQQALPTFDREVIRRGAHTLKGSSGSIGIMTLAAASAELEAVATTGSKNEVETAIHTLHAEYQTIADALQ